MKAGKGPWREVAALPKGRRMNGSWPDLLQIFAHVASLVRLSLV